MLITLFYILVDFELFGSLSENKTYLRVEKFNTTFGKLMQQYL